MKLRRYRHGALHIDGWATPDGEVAVYWPLIDPPALVPGETYPILRPDVARAPHWRVEHLASGHVYQDDIPTLREARAVAEEATQVLRVPAETLRKLMKAPALNKIVHARMGERLMITDRALMTLRGIVQVSMLINVFLLANEVFKEFYSGNLHVASSKYLFVGLHGHHALVPWIWTAIALNLGAMVLLVLPVSRSLKWLNLTCVMCIIGIWIEKGMGLIIPGFVPSPLADFSAIVGSEPG